MPVELDNEIALVRLAQYGSAEAFGVLVDNYERQLYRLLRAITVNDEDAEELLETIFLQARENLGEFKGEERVYTWLARIAVHAAIVRLRRRHPFIWDSFAGPVDRADGMSGPGRVQEWTRDPRCSYSETDLDAILSRALEDLETPLRIIFVLGDIDGFSVEEIADILDLSLPVAKTCWTHARLKLRDNLSIWFEKLSVSASK